MACLTRRESGNLAIDSADRQKNRLRKYRMEANCLDITPDGDRVRIPSKKDRANCAFRSASEKVHPGFARQVRVRQVIPTILVDHLDFAGLRAAVTLRDLEFDLLPFLKCLTAISDDSRVVDENVRTSIGGGNESVPSRVVEPLHGAFHYDHLCLVGSGRAPAETNAAPIEPGSRSDNALSVSV